jgi:hypothetical protein
MKRNIKYILSKLAMPAACSCVILLAGCSLDEHLYDTLTQDQIKTKDDMTNLIKGGYAEFNDGAAFKMWGMMMTTLAADDIYATGGQFESYGRKTFNSATTEQMWNSMYRTIRNASYVLKTAGEIDLDEAYLTRAIGEASFLRAFAYYYLVRLYGGVPIRTEAVDIYSDFHLPRNTVDEVYDRIFRDLSVAVNSLPQANAISPDELGRASKGAAQGIMASARLTYGNYLENNGREGYAEQYDIAVQYADKVIADPSYDLLNDYGGLWNVSREKEAYKEVIFGIRFSRDAKESALGSSGSEFAYRFLPENIYRVTGAPAANATAPPGRGENNLRVHPYFVNNYFTDPQYSETVQDDPSKMDYRIEKSFLTRWQNEANGKYIHCAPMAVVDPVVLADMAGLSVSRTQPYIYKYVDGEGKDNRNHENDFYILRLAEIYLIKAEALNELEGPGSRAIDAFNEVRKRARLADGTPREYPKLIDSDTYPGQAAFRKAILDERGLELVAEGVRWFDLVRMKHPTAAGKTMHDYVFTELADPLKYSQTLPSFDAATNSWTNPNAVSWAHINTICTGIGASNKFLLFPVPLSEIDNNKNINSEDQNPGW